MKLKTLLITSMFILAFAVTSFAAINISDRTGTVQINMPDGTTVIVTADQPLPVIPDGASITILSGVANISTTGTSVVTVSIGDSTVQVSAGSTIALTLSANGTINVTASSGQAVVTSNGTTTTLDSTSPTFELTAEPYTPPENPEIPDLGTGADTEETAKDISPTI
jgi:hypothetical protein